MTSPPKTVLIADDEPALCLLIADELSACGFDCHSVSSGEEARDLLAAERYDLLIADIAMPQVSGLDLLACARQYAPHCRVILTTGQSSRQYLAQALILGAFDYIEKPFDLGALVRAARRATAGEADIPNLPVRAAEAMSVGQRARYAALESVRALARAVEAKDPYTRRHSEQVTHYAGCLAEALGAPERLCGSLRTAALLHDIGKIGVPDRILTKPGKLTDDEFEHIRRHPTLGAEILSNITLFGQEALVVRHHHENWDGTGYPDGLAGEEIPWASRVIHVADAMDGMLMARTYKDAYAVEEMLTQLSCCAGRQFDPDVAAAAVTWCRQNPDKLVLPSRPIETLAESLLP